MIIYPNKTSGIVKIYDVSTENIIGIYYLKANDQGNLTSNTKYTVQQIAQAYIDFNIPLTASLQEVEDRYKDKIIENFPNEKLKLLKN